MHLQDDAPHSQRSRRQSEGVPVPRRMATFSLKHAFASEHSGTIDLEHGRGFRRIVSNDADVLLHPHLDNLALHELRIEVFRLLVNPVAEDQMLLAEAELARRRQRTSQR